MKRDCNNETQPLLHVSVNVMDSDECIFNEESLVVVPSTSAAVLPSSPAKEVINLCDERDDASDDSEESKTESKYGGDDAHPIQPVQAISADLPTPVAEINKQKEFLTYCIQHICSSRQVNVSFQFFKSFYNSLKSN